MDIFPVFRGISYPVVKTPQFSTIIQTTVSGKEIRAGNASIPLWRFALNFEFLTKADYERILQFYHQRRGAAHAFLFFDPSDYAAADQYIGLGDGVQTEFQLCRILDTLQEPIKYPKSVDEVKLSGEAILDYILKPNGIISFGTAPPVGKIITASYSYYYKVRFSEETEYEKFAFALWSLKQLTLTSDKG